MTSLDADGIVGVHGVGAARHPEVEGLDGAADVSKIL